MGVERIDHDTATLLRTRLRANAQSILMETPA
jgi:hypothetical protein